MIGGYQQGRGHFKNIYSMPFNLRDTTQLCHWTPVMGKITFYSIQSPFDLKRIADLIQTLCSVIY